APEEAKLSGSGESSDDEVEAVDAWKKEEHDDDERGERLERTRSWHHGKRSTLSERLDDARREFRDMDGRDPGLRRLSRSSLLLDRRKDRLTHKMASLKTKGREQENEMYRLQTRRAKQRLENKVLELESKRKYMADRTELEAKTLENHKLVGKLQRMRRELEEARSEMQASQIKPLQDQLLAAQSANAALQASLNERTEYVSKLEAEASQGASALTAEIFKQGEALENAEVQMRAQRCQLEDGAKAREHDRQNWKAQTQALERQCSLLRDENTNLLLRLDKAQIRTQELEKAEALFPKKRIESLEEELTRLMRVNTEQSAALTESQSQVSGLEKQVAQATERLEECARFAALKEREVEAREQAEEKLHAELVNCSAQIHRTKVKMLGRELHLCRHLQEAQNQVVNLEADLLLARQGEASLQERLQTLESRFRDREEINRDFENQLRELAEESRVYRAKSMARVQALETDLANSHAQVHAAQQESVELELRIKAAAADAAKIKEHHVKASKRLHEALEREWYRANHFRELSKPSKSRDSVAVKPKRVGALLFVGQFAWISLRRRLSWAATSIEQHKHERSLALRNMIVAFALLRFHDARRQSQEQSEEADDDGESFVSFTSAESDQSCKACGIQSDLVRESARRVKDLERMHFVEQERQHRLCLQLQTETTRHHAAVERLEIVHSELQDCRERERTHKKQVAQLEASLSKTQHERQCAAKEAREHQVALAGVRHETKLAQDTIDFLQGQVTELQSDLKGVNTDLAKLVAGVEASKLESLKAVRRREKAERDVAELQRKCEALDSHNELLQVQLNESRRTAANAETQHTNSLARLEQRLETQVKAAEERSEQVAALKAAARGHERERANFELLQSEHERLRQLLGEEQSKVGQLESQKDVLRRQVEDLSDTGRDASTSLSRALRTEQELLEEVSRLTLELESRSRENTALRRNCDEAQNGKERVNRARLAVIEESERMRETLDRAKDTNAQLQARTAELERDVVTQRALTAANGKEAAEARENLAQAQKQVDMLQEACADRSHWQQRARYLDSRIELLQVRLDETLGSLQSKTEQLDRAQGVTRDLRTELKRVSDCLEIEVAKTETLSQRADKLEATERANSRLRQCVACSQASVVRLEAALDIALPFRGRFHAAAIRAILCGIGVVQWRRTAERLEANANALSAVLAEKDNLIHGLERRANDLDDVEKAYHALQQDHTNWEAERASLEEALESAVSLAAESQASLNVRNAEWAAAQQALDADRLRLEEMATDLQQRRQGVQRAEQDVSERAAELEAKLSELRKGESILRKNRLHVEMQKNTLEDHKITNTQLQSLTAQLRIQEQANEVLSKELAELQDRLKHGAVGRDELHQLHEEKETLEDLLDRSQQEMDRLQRLM
ncbi:unnamed protein product, partial [Durusdinium trenchii]